MNLPWSKPRRKSPILFGGLIVLLLWLPIPLGSNRPWSWALMEIWIYLLGALWLVQYARGKAGVSEPFRKATPALALAILWLGYGIAQMLPLPFSVVNALSPDAAEMYQKANLGPSLTGIPIAPDDNGPEMFVLDLEHAAALLQQHRQDNNIGTSSDVIPAITPAAADLPSLEPSSADAVAATPEQPSGLADPKGESMASAARNSGVAEGGSSGINANSELTDQPNLVPYRLTLDIRASIVTWLKSFAYVLLFALTLLLVDSTHRLKILIYALIFSGIVQAIYGSLSVAFAGSGVATGTFVNRNHYAAYLVLCLAIGIGLLISWSAEQQQNRSWRRWLRDIAKLVLSPKAPLRIFLAIMVIALVLTHSRMGNTSFFWLSLSWGGSP